MSRWNASDLKAVGWTGERRRVFKAPDGSLLDDRGLTVVKQSPAKALKRPRIDSAVAGDGNGSTASVGKPARSFSLILPWPPTGNHGTKHTKTGKHYLTQAHRTYRSEVAYRVNQSRVLTIRGKYRMSVVCHPPDRRKRDFDNVQKTFCDALQHAQAIADDCYMRQLVVLWHDWSRQEPARIVVDVAELSL